jgi:hypothetical protein
MFFSCPGCTLVTTAGEFCSQKEAKRVVFSVIAPWTDDSANVESSHRFCHRVEDDVIVANNSSVGGHVLLQRGCRIGGHSAVHQHVRVGAHSMVGGLSAIRRDVLPYTVVSGAPPELRSLNYAQLWPVLGFSARRVALALFHLLFPPSSLRPGSSLQIRAASLSLALPILKPSVPLLDRFNALDDVLDTLVEDLCSSGSACASVRCEIQTVADMFGAMSKFAKSSRRGIYVPHSAGR